MTNLDKIMKDKDISMAAKSGIVKTKVFLMVKLTVKAGH